MKEKILAFIGLSIGILVVIIGLGALFGFPVKWLWNALMPDIFNLPKITWLQAWGLLVLSGFLFKSTNASSK